MFRIHFPSHRRSSATSCSALFSVSSLREQKHRVVSAFSDLCTTSSNSLFLLQVSSQGKVKVPPRLSHQLIKTQLFKCFFGGFVADDCFNPVDI